MTSRNILHLTEHRIAYNNSSNPLEILKKEIHIIGNEKYLASVHGDDDEDEALLSPEERAAEERPAADSVTSVPEWP